jgi:hypothetical protein
MVCASEHAMLDRHDAVDEQTEALPNRDREAFIVCSGGGGPEEGARRPTPLHTDRQVVLVQHAGGDVDPAEPISTDIPHRALPEIRQ